MLLGIFEVEAATIGKFCQYAGAHSMETKRRTSVGRRSLNYKRQRCFYHGRKSQMLPSAVIGRPGINVAKHKSKTFSEPCVRIGVVDDQQIE